ncbi:MAG: serine kinase [Burkholderiales bacterium]|nr:MAG: serine kinase [Burkholderiales bacterium]
MSRSHVVMGAAVDFVSDSADLLALADRAYAGLPAPACDGPPLTVELRLTPGGNRFDDAPPAARMLGGAGLLGAAVDGDHLALINPAAGRALVQVTTALLRWPYHLRYELIEFAVFTLVARARRLAALHAGAVGLAGRGVLVMGASGAGKSTLAAQAMALGLELLTEDAAFVEPDTLLAVGVPNFLHLRCDSVDVLDDAPLQARLRASPVIERRSGVRKFELDLRQAGGLTTAGPLRLEHLVFASPEPAGAGGLLQRLSADETRARLHTSQPYAAGQPGWSAVLAGCARLHGWALRRGRSPQEGALALRSLLMG